MDLTKLLVFSDDNVCKSNLHRNSRIEPSTLGLVLSKIF